MAAHIGFIGLGNVGSKLAGSLLRNGFPVVVRDLDASAAEPLLEAGATWGESPRAMAEACDIVITCLPSPAASASVMEGGDGLIHGLDAGKVWAEMSTTDEAEVRRLGTMVEATGARELSPNVIRRLEEATGLDVVAQGFPAEILDDEPEQPGYEVGA